MYIVSTQIVCTNLHLSNIHTHSISVVFMEITMNSFMKNVLKEKQINKSNSTTKKITLSILYWIVSCTCLSLFKLQSVKSCQISRNTSKTHMNVNNKQYLDFFVCLTAKLCSILYFCSLFKLLYKILVPTVGWNEQKVTSKLFFF